MRKYIRTVETFGNIFPPQFSKNLFRRVKPPQPQGIASIFAGQHSLDSRPFSNSPVDLSSWTALNATTGSKQQPLTGQALTNQQALMSVCLARPSTLPQALTYVDLLCSYRFAIANKTVADEPFLLRLDHASAGNARTRRERSGANLRCDDFQRTHPHQSATFT